jgi:RimJ/RimL family protein N-acetyltransferase
MQPHPDFAAIDLPRECNLGGFRLTPLSPDQVEEDYAAVMSSADVLRGFFGDWPEGLTLEDDLVDLAWHEREFTTRRSFAWIIRDGDGHYLGCAYIFPAPGERGRADVATWIRDMPDRLSTQDLFNALFRKWLEEVLPSGISLSWSSPS